MEDVMAKLQAEKDEVDHRVAAKSRAIFDERQLRLSVATSRMFGHLMVLQWAAAIVVALLVSPRTWAGAASQPHLHLWAALALGGIVSALPAWLAFRRPEDPATPYVVASGQVMMSALLIHLSGGRIETHFHVFGSLAFIAFYRDWRVLVVPVAIVAVDHLVRGIYWPQSVFGVVTASSWRWFEHACWVLFECFFLVLSIRRSRAEMHEMAERQAQVEETLRPFLAGEA